MKALKTINYIFVFSILFFGLFLSTSAFIDVSKLRGPNDAVILTDPKFPTAREVISLYVDFAQVDLASTNISWYINGDLVESGIGVERITVKVGDPGSSQVIRVEITRDDGSITEAILNLRPVTVDILWEVNTYTPPLYNGKSLPSSESTLKIIALPNFVSQGASEDPSTLIYLWKRDGARLSSQSGGGKQFIEIPAARGRTDLRIELEVRNLSDTLRTKSSIRIRTIRPSILFYALNPLSGPQYNNELGNNVALTSQELSILAEPFHFSNEAVESNQLNYFWKVNNQSVDVDATIPQRLILGRNEEGRGGNATILLTIENLLQKLQSFTRSISISF